VLSTRLLLATRNAGKLAELRRLLETAVSGVEVIGLRDVPDYPEAPETGATFEENALLKAREAVRYTGLPAVADDSGLTVDALNGMPGVLSARWSGRQAGVPDRLPGLEQRVLLEGRPGLGRLRVLLDVPETDDLHSGDGGLEQPLQLR
jgi:non-canonical purine NTP pyrophosphatase (RdgB/HAM1 family)